MGTHINVRMMRVALWLLEITTAATGAQLSLWEVEDEIPQDQLLPGEIQLPVMRNSLGLTLISP